MAGGTEGAADRKHGVGKEIDDSGALSGEALLKAKAAEFQWEVQWYPVGWAVDFEKGKLHKVTLFDKDYVLLCHQGMATLVRLGQNRRGHGVPIGLLDV